MNPADIPEIFKPPVNRSMQVLDRSFFQKVVPLSALSITDVKQISNVRSQLTKSQATIAIPTIKILQDDDSTPGAKCFLLRPGIHADRKSTKDMSSKYSTLISLESSTWPQVVSDLVESGTTKIRPFDLKLTYEGWTMREWFYLDGHPDTVGLNLPHQITSLRPSSQICWMTTKKPQQDFLRLATLVSPVLISLRLSY
jgi:hypothetical protein